MTDKLKDLRIEQGQKQRSQSSMWAVFVGVTLIIVAAVFLAWPRASDSERTVKKENDAAPDSISTNVAGPVSRPAAGAPDGVVLTVSGYIVNRARIEISPRFLSAVRQAWSRRIPDVDGLQQVGEEGIAEEEMW